MDMIQFILGVYSVTLAIRGCRSSLILPVGFLDTMDQPCHRKCKYGYEADVEGNTMCKCFDPCAHIFCPFEGTKCVVRRDHICRHGYCKYEATCKKVTDQKKKRKWDNYKPDRHVNEAYYGVQRDSTDIGVTSLCSRQPSIPNGKGCGRKSVGYYFDGVKGTCIRFKGCHTQGDFFIRRRDCKRSCVKRSHIISSDLSMRRKSDCLLQIPDWTKCTNLHRVWHYDQQKRKCVKSKGCSYTENSFPTKLQCKRLCKVRHKKKFSRRFIT